MIRWVRLKFLWCREMYRIVERSRVEPRSSFGRPQVTRLFEKKIIFQLPKSKRRGTNGSAFRFLVFRQWENTKLPYNENCQIVLSDSEFLPYAFLPSSVFLPFFNHLPVP